MSHDSPNSAAYQLDIRGPDGHCTHDALHAVVMWLDRHCHGSFRHSLAASPDRFVLFAAAAKRFGLVCDVLLCSTYRPFPIVMGSILLADTPLGFYTFEVRLPVRPLQQPHACTVPVCHSVGCHPGMCRSDRVV